MAGQGDIIINSLEGLDNLTDESYPRTVMNNIDTIFRHGKDDIIAKLKEKNSDSDETRKELRQLLLTEVKNVIPDCANKTPINRTSSDRICSDIYILGMSIKEKAPHTDLHKVYNDKPEATEPQLSVDDVAGIIRAVTLQANRIQTLEKENADIKKEHADLKEWSKNEISKLTSQLRRISEDNTSIDTQAEAQEPQNNNNTENEENTANNEEEANGIFNPDRTQPEDSEPHTPSRPRILPAKKTTDLFIANVDASHSCEDIKRYMNTGTSLCMELNNIKEAHVRGDKKAFKVSVPLEKMDEAKSIWQSGIRVERYLPNNMKIKPAHSINSQARNNNTNSRNNNNNNRNNRNRNNNENNYNRSNRDRRNSRERSFPPRRQNRQEPHWSDQYSHPSANSHYAPAPNVPSRSHQYWGDQHRTTEWYQPSSYQPRTPEWYQPSPYNY